MVNGSWKARVRWAAFTAIWALSSSCAHSPGRAAEKPQSPSAERYVVLDPAAVLHTEAVEPSESLIGTASSAIADSLRSLGIFNVYRVIEERDGWVEVESLGDPAPDSHCYGAGPLAGMRLRLFVRPADLMRVTARPWKIGFADGTHISLVSGVALRPDTRVTAKNAFLVDVDGLAFSVHLPEEATGYAYGPSTHFQTEETGQFISNAAAEAGALRVGGSYIAPHRLRVALFVYSARPAPEGMLATLRSDCGEYEVLVRPDQILPFSGIGGLLGSSDGPAVAAARPGAKAYWRSGREAGTVVKEWGFDAKVESAQGRRCFRKALYEGAKEPASGPSPVLVLCFNPNDIVEKH